MSKTIKVHNHTLTLLSNLKSEYTNLYPNREVTFDLAINELIGEHEENTDPDFVKEKEEALLEKYILRSEYGSLESRYYELRDKNIANEEKLKETTEDYENKIQEIKDGKVQLEHELKKQREIDGKLQSSLANRKNEVAKLKAQNEKLTQCLLEIKNSLPKLDERYNELKVEYNKLQHSMTNDYCEKDHLIALYDIARLLMRHKRSVFSVEQIATKTHIISFKVADALNLVAYKIFPIRRYKQGQEILYYFDRKYLRW